ncbi:unnamed protein product, partial [marine sediment metagenome]
MSLLRTSGNRTDENGVPYWRVMKSNGRRPRVGTNGIDLGIRGIYDKRNMLNDLTGREWIYFLNSVWVTAYPPVADTIGFDVRKVHPSPKPPQLMRDIIHFFTKKHEWILDPFAGVGGTLVGASLAEPQRYAVGIEIVQQYVDAYYEVTKCQGLKLQDMICGDARNVEVLTKRFGREFDLVLTDPPYYDMMNRRKPGQKKKLYGTDKSSPFSALKEDISNLPYNEFLDTLRDIIYSATKLLRRKRYLVVFCRDLQPTKDNPNLIHADIIRKLTEVPEITYRGM